MTFAPIILIDVRGPAGFDHAEKVTDNAQQRLGRRQLLTLSGAGAILSLVGVGFGLDSGLVTLASVAVMAFIAYVCYSSALLSTLSSLTTSCRAGLSLLALAPFRSS